MFPFSEDMIYCVFMTLTHNVADGMLKELSL